MSNGNGKLRAVPIASFVDRLFRALDYEVETYAGGLLVRRRLIGGESVMYARATTALVGASYRSHADALLRVREGHPNAVLRLIVDEPPGVAYQAAAADNNILLQTRVEFLNDLIDSEKLAKQVLRDPRVRASAMTYVPQDLRDEQGNLLGATSSYYVLREWLAASDKTLLVILAQAGQGKTSLTRALAHNLAVEHQFEPNSPIPLLIPFAEYRTLTDFRSLILRRLEDAKVMFTSPAFQLVLAAGRAVLLLDGFDELSEEAGYEVSKRNLRLLSEHIAGSGAKIIITSRSAFFRTSRELSDAILRNFDQSNITVLELADFSTAQQRDFLQRAWGDEGRRFDDAQIDRVIGRIQTEESLQALAGSPLLLELIAESTAAGPLQSRTGLYASFVEFVCARERERYEYEVSNASQRDLLIDVARDMYKDNTFVYDRDDLLLYFIDPVVDALVLGADDTELERVKLREKLADHALLDTVEGQAALQFRHPTFRDYFVAQWLAQLVRDRKDTELREALARRRMPDNVASFLADMLIDTSDAGQIRDLAWQDINEPVVTWNIVRLAVAMSERAGEDPLGATEIFRRIIPADAPLRRFDLREMVFRNLDLSGSDWRGANLEDATFNRCVLEKTDFSGCLVKQTGFIRCRLGGTLFTDSAAIVSIKTDDGDDAFIETNVGVRQWLRDHGAVVDETDLVGPIRADPGELAEELVRHVFRKFYRLGSMHWELSLRYDSVLSGLGGERRRMVDSRVIPELRHRGFLIEERKTGRIEILFNVHRKAEVRDYLDNQQGSDDIAGAIQRVAAALG